MPAAPRLRELQQGFADALSGRGDAVSTWIEGAGLAPTARLQIYRHAVAGTLEAALRDSYPVVLALVGEDFFEVLVARYRLQHPSTSGNLQHFGAALADFIAQMPEAQALGYLPDVARLEWLRQTAALAAEATAVEAAALVRAAEREPEHLQLWLHPSVQLLRSDHAVLTIWQWCQAADGSELRLDGSAEQVLLWRDGHEVAMALLDPATYACIEALHEGKPLAAACAAATGMDGDFNPEPCLRDLLAQGLIVACNDEE